MSEMERKVLETIERTIPLMSERQKGFFLGYGEAIADLKDDMEMKVKEVMEEKKKLVEAK